MKLLNGHWKPVPSPPNKHAKLLPTPTRGRHQAQVLTRYGGQAIVLSNISSELKTPKENVSNQNPPRSCVFAQPRFRVSVGKWRRQTNLLYMLLHVHVVCFWS